MNFWTLFILYVGTLECLTKAINDHIQAIKFTLLRFKTNLAMFK